MEIILKRPYHFNPEPDDYVVLVDRLWPRGVRKTALKLDEWNKIITPSPELRKWFNHDPEKLETFRSKYLQELQHQRSELSRLRDIASNRRLVLVYAAKNPTVNHALILKEAIENA
jgi:uncharacterized protein YeaO (DUF488 family)